MKEIAFSEIKEGESFRYAAETWVRIRDERVSCCKVMNAAKASSPSEKTQIGGSVMVQVDD